MKNQMKLIGEGKEMIVFENYEVMGIMVDVCFKDGSETFEMRVQQFKEVINMSK